MAYLGVAYGVILGVLWVAEVAGGVIKFRLKWRSAGYSHNPCSPYDRRVRPQVHSDETGTAQRLGANGMVSVPL